MNLERYPYYTNNEFQEYSFYSEGLRGITKKIVKFMKAQDDPVVFNLGFGDEDPITGMVLDTVTTNNKDTDIVLATVANTINTFCDHYGNHYIYAEGSTPARTRLYQMSISRLLTEINLDFDVFGLKNGDFTTFQQNVNYDGFLVKRRIKL